MLRDISLHIMDLVQNSVSAGAALVSVAIEAEPDADLLRVIISDNGCGMSAEFLANVADPFTTSRTTRKVGMGIPFFKLACEQADGGIELWSEPGKGTTIIGQFCISHIDRLPLGDVGDSVRYLIMGSPKIDFVLTLSAGKKSFVFDTREVKRELGDVPITEYDIMVWIKESIDEEVTNIFGGVLNEIIGRTESPEGKGQS